MSLRPERQCSPALTTSTPNTDVSSTLLNINSPRQSSHFLQKATSSQDLEALHISGRRITLHAFRALSTADFQTSEAKLNNILSGRRLPALAYHGRDPGHDAIGFFVQLDGCVALAARLAAALVEDEAAEDFDFPDGLAGAVGELPHLVCDGPVVEVSNTPGFLVLRFGAEIEPEVDDLAPDQVEQLLPDRGTFHVDSLGNVLCPDLFLVHGAV